MIANIPFYRLNRAAKRTYRNSKARSFAAVGTAGAIGQINN